jgi:hypothetical protein
MSCYNQASSSFAIRSPRSSSRRDPSAVLRAIVAVIEAFYEALEMRRAAYRRYHLSNE